MDDTHPTAAVVPPGQGRTFPTGRSQAHVKIEPGHSPGFAAFEATQEPGLPGPPPHVHRDYDEAWYIIEGRMEFELGDHTHLCPAGSMVIAPRGTAHTFHNPGPDPARMLAILTPQALQLIEELGQLAADGPPPATALRSLLARHETFTVDHR